MLSVFLFSNRHSLATFHCMPTCAYIILTSLPLVETGPSRLAGISSGNTTSHEWMKSHSVDAYLGLARGLFRVTQDCTSTARASCADIDADAGRGPTTVKLSGCDVTTPIVVEASSPGFAPVTISIRVSTDVSNDGVMAVARATGDSFAGGFSYLKDFVG